MEGAPATVTDRWVEAKLDHFEDGTINVSIWLVRPGGPQLLYFRNVENETAATARVHADAEAHGIDPKNVTIRHLNRDNTARRNA